MKIEVLYFDVCRNRKPAVERVRQVLAEEGISAEVLEVNVTDASVAQRVGFLGSPTIRVNGLDVEPEARRARAYGMMCRTYAVNGRREGLPSREMLRQSDPRREFQFGSRAEVLMRQWRYLGSTCLKKRCWREFDRSRSAELEL